MSLAQQIIEGNRRALARLITQIENDRPEAQAALAKLYPQTGRAHLVGVTGAPGTGKSSLVNELTKGYRNHEQPKTVAILAVDPTSPFSGGAILGDRIRMKALAGDPGVYIRSMASRGSRGGLARAVDDAVRALDAAGFDLIIIETVGAGQSEVEIAKTAQTVIVVEAPGLGDDVQAIKAGILEIANIFVVNKADRAGAERAVAALRTMLELGHTPTHQTLHHGQLLTVTGNPVSPSLDSQSGPRWEVPILKTVAIKGEGTDQVIAKINDHFEYLKASGELAQRNRNRLLESLEAILQAELLKQFLDQAPAEALTRITEQLEKRELTPYSAAKELLAIAYGPDQTAEV